LVSQAKSHFANLDGHNYMSLKTFRRSGEGVPTPVWFAQVGETLYVTTNGSSGKVKRLRHTQAVEVAPCDVRGNLLGDYVPAQARIIEDEQQAKQADRHLSQKYTWQYFLFTRVLPRFRRSMDNGVYLEIEPIG
jgi:hypothetical protein